MYKHRHCLELPDFKNSVGPHSRISSHSPPTLLFAAGWQGCQIFLVQCTKTWRNMYTKDQRISQMIAEYTKWPHNISNVSKIYQHFPFQGPTKFTQTGIYIKSGSPAWLAGLWFSDAFAATLSSHDLRVCQQHREQNANKRWRLSWIHLFELASEWKILK
jgi:hypothetical protein